MARALGGDGEPVELARQPDSEVANVDHLLDLAEPLLEDLARLEADESAESLFLLAKYLPEQAHQLAPPGRGHFPPGEEGLVRRPDRLPDLRGRRRLDLPDSPPVDRREAMQIPIAGAHPKRAEHALRFANGIEGHGAALGWDRCRWKRMFPLPLAGGG
jgi:hypothetical protein